MKIFCRLLSGLLTFICLVVPFSAATAAFSDTQGHVYSDAIDYVQTNGVVKGYADGTYRPDISINRAEFTKILVEGDFPGQFNGVSCSNFSDVKSSDWFMPYVCFAYDKGIIKGYPDGSFGPGKNISFAEAAKIIVNVGLVSNPDLSLPSDPVWYKPFVLVMEKLGAIPTSINRFDQNITRGELAEMYYRVAANISNKPSQTYAGLEQSAAASSPSTSGNAGSVTPFQNSGFAGIYAGVESKLQFQPNFSQPGGGSYVNRLIQYNWVFLSNGKMYNSIPADGNVQGYCDSNSCGSYNVSGSQVSVTFPDGNTSTYSLSNGGIKLNGNVTLRKATGVSSLKLNGTWHRSNYVVAGSTGVGSEQYITFNNDGTFSTSNFTGFTTDGPYAGGYGNLSGDSSGTYAINNYSIELNYNNGFAVRHTFFQYGGEDTINMDGKSFIK